MITTNLALLNDEVLDFCAEHDVLLSTSLDGPRDLHNKNRPRRGQNSYELAVAGIARIKERLGSDRGRSFDDDNRSEPGSRRGDRRRVP